MEFLIKRTDGEWFDDYQEGGSKGAPGTGPITSSRRKPFVSFKFGSLFK